MTFSSSKVSPRMRAVGIATIAVSIGVILTVGRDPVTTTSVEESLKHFSDYVATDIAKSGKEGKFTYGAIEMKGWFFDRLAMVHDVNLEVKKQTLLESVTWALSTPQMAVVPDQVLAKRMYYVFGAPIAIKKNGQDVASLSFSEPLKYGQLEARRGDSQSLMQNFKLPGSITITPTNLADGGNVVITYAKNPTVEITSSLEHSERHAEYAFKDIAVTSGETKPLTIGSLQSNLTEKPDDKGLLEGNYTLNVSAVKTEANPKPCDIAADISYTGDQPLMKLAGFVAGSEATTVSVKKASLDCADFKVSADGSLARSPEDPLPSGALTLHLEQVSALFASPMLSDQSKAVLSQILVKVTGQPVDTLKNLEIPLKREKNGTFYIGDVTFEELAASIFTNMIGIPAPITVPAPITSETPTDPQLPDPETTLLDPAGDMPEDSAPATETAK